MQLQEHEQTLQAPARCCRFEECSILGGEFGGEIFERVLEERSGEAGAAASGVHLALHL